MLPIGHLTDVEVSRASALRQKGTVANSLWGESDCSVVINYALAIERRGRAGGRESVMLAADGRLVDPA
jgi:hypothetical protein